MLCWEWADDRLFTVWTDADVKQQGSGSQSDAADGISNDTSKESDVVMAVAADDVVKHDSHVTVNYLDTGTEEHAESIVADSGHDVDDISDSVSTAKSDVSFFSSILQHLTLLLDSFEALVDIDDDDVERKLNASLFIICLFFICCSI